MNDTNPEQPRLYACPMHPEIIQKSPGLCPECGMNLIPIKPKKQDGLHTMDHSGRDDNAAFNKHEGHNTNIFKIKFWVSFALSIPLVLYSDMMQTIFHWSVPTFPGSICVELLLASIIFFYGGWVFIASA
jgi:Cu2+-exporting ATPase